MGDVGESGSGAQCERGRHSRPLQSNRRLLVHVLSSEVYRDGTRPAIDGGHPIRPKTPYAANKVAAEGCVNAFRETYDLPCVILRPFNTFGPRQRGFKRHESDRDGGVVSKSVYAALHGGEVVICGDGKQARDYVYVKDCVKGIFAASQESLRGQIMNFGSGRAISLGEIVDQVAKATRNTELKVTCKPRETGRCPNNLTLFAFLISLHSNVGRTGTPSPWPQAVQVRYG